LSAATLPRSNSRTSVDAGVEKLGDYAVQIRAKMMTVPGEQFVIRRKAYAMIKKAFDEHGIKFAFRPCRSQAKAKPPLLRPRTARLS
jgi:small-conductance mechanosensitive channel